MFCTVFNRMVEDCFCHLDIHSHHIVAVVLAGIGNGPLMEYSINATDGIPVDVLHIPVEERSFKIRQLLFVRHAGEHDIVSSRSEREGEGWGHKTSTARNKSAPEVPIITP